MSKQHAYLHAEIVSHGDDKRHDYRHYDGEEVVQVNKPIESVDGVLEYLFNQYCEPQAVELREKTGKDGYGATPLAEFGLEASLRALDVVLDLIVGEAKIVEKDLLNEFVGFGECLQNQNQQEKATHVPPI
jgi:hypothetical protein